MEKMYCFECDKDVIGEVRVEKINHNIHGQNVVIDERVFTCPICGTEYDFDSYDVFVHDINVAYLNIFGLSFEKLKEIRESLNLSQELFAEALGWSKKTINRYENAESLPQKEYLDTYISLLNNKSNIYSILKNNNNLTKEKYYKILNRINVEINFKSINVILYILNKVKLNRTQLMKYLFAIDFLNYKLFNKSISEFKYAHATYGPIVNDQDALINLLIKQDYIKLESSFIDNSMLFVPLQKADLSNFSEQEINVLNKIINNFKGMSANELTDWSHAFIGWIKTKDGEIIDFKYAKELDI
ncbi:MAG: type II toxin-antitoxin system antitoxin SocA domain-containing protein [Bacilli bacterium]